LPFFFVHVAIVAAEERYFPEQFDEECDAPCPRTARFVPRSSGIGSTPRSMTFDWKRLVRKESGTFFSTVTAILGILVWEKISVVGLFPTRAEVSAIRWLWLVCIAAYLTARVLKKSGSLGRG
jgi:hypothetical protein